MALSDLAVGGSAPRDGETKELFSPESWGIMKAHLSDFCEEHNVKTGIAFGQGCPDHLIIQLFNEGKLERLELHCPGNFDVKQKKFVYQWEGGKANRKHVEGTNHYHKVLSELIGVDTLDEVAQCFGHRPGQSFYIHPHWDYFRRNEEGVKRARIFIAYSKAETKKEFLENRGGTKFTWNRHKWAGVGFRVFVSIPELIAQNTSTP